MERTGYALIAVCFAITLGLIALEALLSFRKNRNVGLIPIGLIFILMIGLGSYTKQIQSGYETEEYEIEIGDHLTAEITVRFNEADEPVSFSHLVIRDERQEIVDVAPIQVGNQVRCRYEKPARIFTEKYGLNGESEDLETVLSNAVKFGDYRIYPKSYFLAAGVFNLPLLAIYLLIRQRQRLHLRKEETKRLLIELLH